jgi:hypothetical protein
MIRDRTLQARDKLLGKLPVTGEMVRGALLERTVRLHNPSQAGH